MTAMETVTVHSLADGLAAVLKADFREAIAYHDLNSATVSVELDNGQRFFLSIAEDDTE